MKKQISLFHDITFSSNKFPTSSDNVEIFFYLINLTIKINSIELTFFLQILIMEVQGVPHLTLPFHHRRLLPVPRQVRVNNSNSLFLGNKNDI